MLTVYYSSYVSPDELEAIRHLPMWRGALGESYCNAEALRETKGRPGVIVQDEDGTVIARNIFELADWPRETGRVLC